MYIDMFLIREMSSRALHEFSGLKLRQDNESYWIAIYLSGVMQDIFDVFTNSTRVSFC